ncbi:peroxidase 44-like [Solanum dulcamara]|uniref:peroxidase 44-like n=1 Tax=Solanum dulcamara TaxID=45834 RepID=UPI002486C429|nr:peroxidase 44-like [Solanum dulcamara]
MDKKILLLLFFLCISLHLAAIVSAQLQVGFYNTKARCPPAETIVRDTVRSQFSKDRSITAALLRMYFHDCFVRGCDASILIDSKNTKNKKSEKDAGANGSVRGYELIDQIKSKLEATCSMTVSCADIIALATRDAVALAGGPSYIISTGRRDGLVSDPSQVNLPGPSLTVPQAFQSFKSKGFTINEMVTLLGGHTVGITHCSFIQGDRLSRADGSMDIKLFSTLRKTCNSKGDPSVFLDQNTSFVVDNSFYKQLRLKKGILKVDQLLASDKSTAGIVSNFASNPRAFQQAFANALIKLGNTQVLVGKSGEIRKNCRAFNPPPSPPPKIMKSPPPPPPKITKIPPPPPPKILKSPPPPPPKVSVPPPPPKFPIDHCYLCLAQKLNMASSPFTFSFAQSSTSTSTVVNGRCIVFSINFVHVTLPTKCIIGILIIRPETPD